MSMLLKSLQSCKTEQELENLWDLIKQTKTANSIVEESIKKAKEAGFYPGCKVKMKGDDEIGEMVGFNISNLGFYTGDRYPLLVKFERGIFEYSHEQFEVIE